MAKIKITLEKGLIGTNKKQRATVEAIGLNKREASIVKEDTKALRGMIEKVSHLVKVENVNE